MQKILGIDTGGTYTDGVVIRASDRQILAKAKTLTTRRNLQMCIKNCIEAFPAEELEGVCLVSLSTTLATNAVVEGRGCKEGLILIGGRPEGKMPTGQYRIVQGRPDIMGCMRELINPQEIDEAIEFFRGTVDALAVSGYASVRNPEHEIYVKERIREKLGIPVVCAHELTASLGFYERTVTAVLNARLIPVICNLIDSVKAAMQKYHIEVPLMIVKGDGTLMTEECARDKPIETILSGPAASVIGGMFLSGEKNAIILDMGGTTTDLANVTDGKMRMNNEGANVGGWFTRIRAAEIYTVGLGGDSRIYLDGSRTVCVGPKKVTPYCIAGTWFPALLDELRKIYEAENKPHHQFWRNESEAFMLIRYGDFSKRTEDEKKVLKAIHTTPHTLYVLQHECRLKNLLTVLEKLIADDLVGRIALTPTDILHAEGEYTGWNAEVSKLCVQMMSEQLGQSFDDCIAYVRRMIHRRMNQACVHSGFYYDNQEFGCFKPYCPSQLGRQTMDMKDEIVDELKKKGMALNGQRIVCVSADGHSYGLMLIDNVYTEMHAKVINGGVDVEPAGALDLADEEGASILCISTHCGQCLSYAQSITDLAKARGKKYKIMMGGMLNALLPGNDLPVDVQDLVRETGVCGTNDFCEQINFILGA